MVHSFLSVPLACVVVVFFALLRLLLQCFMSLLKAQLRVILQVDYNILGLGRHFLARYLHRRRHKLTVELRGIFPCRIDKSFYHLSEFLCPPREASSFAYRLCICLSYCMCQRDLGISVGSHIVSITARGILMTLSSRSCCRIKLHRDGTAFCRNGPRLAWSRQT